MTGLAGVVARDQAVVTDRLRRLPVVSDGGKGRHLIPGASHTLALWSAAPDFIAATDTPEACTAVAIAAEPRTTQARRRWAEQFLALWSQAGIKLINRVDNLFAAAVWESGQERLTLLLDWIGGIHTFYFVPLQDGIAFATDLRLLLAMGVADDSIDESALAQYLDFGHILPPATLLKGVNKLAPGCALVWESGHQRVERVYRFDFSGEDASEEELVSRFRARHREAMQRILADMTEPAALLSGGVDSSYNVGVMTELCERPVKTFSVSYPGRSEIDESHYARLVAQRYSTDHHELPLHSPDVLNELPAMIYAIEEPAMDYSFIPTWLIFRFAAQQVPAVVSGDGPDHLFGRHYPVAFVRSTLGRLPGCGPLARLLLADDRSARWKSRLWRRLRRSEKGRMLWKSLQCVARGPVEAYLSIYREIAYRGLLPHGYASIVSSDAFAGTPPMNELLTDSVLGHVDEYQYTSALDLSIDGSFGVFAKVGKTAASHGVGVCEPYLQAPVRDLVLTLPLALKVQGSRLDLLQGRARRKYLLYQAARGVVPDEVLSKPKQGFRAPIGEWLGAWIVGRDAKMLLPALGRETDLLDFAAIDRILDEHRAGYANHGTLIMMLVTLDLWYGVFVTGRGERPSWTWREWLG